MDPSRTANETSDGLQPRIIVAPPRAGQDLEGPDDARWRSPHHEVRAAAAQSSAIGVGSRPHCVVPRSTSLSCRPGGAGCYDVAWGLIPNTTRSASCEIP